LDKKHHKKGTAEWAKECKNGERNSRREFALEDFQNGKKQNQTREKKKREGKGGLICCFETKSRRKDGKG